MTRRLECRHCGTLNRAGNPCRCRSGSLRFKTPAEPSAEELRLQRVRLELLEAAKGLRDDLLLRAEVDCEDGTRVVNASHSRWRRFCDAIDAAEGGS